MLLLDSADLAEVELAAEFGFVAGITTNPMLMAAVKESPLRHLERLLSAAPPGLLFYQPLAADPEPVFQEALVAHALAPERIVVKLPATLPLFQVGRQLAAQGVAVAATAVFAPAQALVAHVAGFSWVIPYVDRAERTVGSDSLVAEIAAPLSRLRGDTRILAASLKRPAQVVRAITNCAHAVSCPLAVIQACAHHDLTDVAVEEFARAFPSPAAPANEPKPGSGAGRERPEPSVSVG
jgi:transaldolase